MKRQDFFANKATLYFTQNIVFILKYTFYQFIIPK